MDLLGIHVFIVVLVACSFINVSRGVDVKIGVLLMTDSWWPFDLKMMGPAIEEGAIVARDVYGVNMELVYHTYPGNCPLSATLGYLMELLNNNTLHAIVGPACSESIMGAARLAEYVKIPMLTGVGDLVVRNPANGDMYKTLTVLSYSVTKLSHSLTAIMQEYGWRHTAVMYDFPQTIFNLAGANLVKDFRSSSDMEHPLEITFDGYKTKDADYDSFLREAATRARVIIIFCNADIFRDIMYQAYLNGMAGGDYVFITLELFPSDWLGHYQLFTRSDYKDAGVTKAYETALILSLRKLDNTEYFTFADKVKARALADHGFVYPAGENPNYYVTAFYDSVMYLANAFNDTVNAGGDITDGMAIAQMYWNSSFQGITGPVGVSEIGDRQADFDLYDMMSPDTRAFQMVGRFRGASQAYVPLNGVEVVWPRGKPLDVPTCGFQGELCVPEAADYTVLIAVLVSVFGFLTLIFSVLFILYRRYRAEQEIGRMSWLIGPDELKSRKGKNNDSFMSKSVLNIDRDQEQQQMFCKTMFCRDQIVAVRALNLTEVELTRKLCVDFRQMQTSTHNLLAKFVGAVITPLNNSILMEYCQRGSLQDMIQNDVIELDWDFRYSLIQDVIKGMTFLHNSPLLVHGHLTSANCVVDSKFSLKITDYGPHELLDVDRLKGYELAKEGGETINLRKMLWVAPEHIDAQLLQASSSQAGDVYSFAIILHELIMRCEPFDETGMEVEDILRQLRTRVPAVLRPSLGDDEQCAPELRNLATNCWNDTPEDRPSFNDIEEIYKKIRRGKKTNIMDNLLQRMSDYADNLEQLAADRTQAYLAEKDKVEELLHRLLPPSIANQLQTGQRVAPESFDCVSIYFSDIVGFTVICGASTPIQVVDLLNDLYTAFDSTIELFKVYKVETIGDAYMCVSGLPERIGDRHALEICNMSLAIRHRVRDFTISHMPEEVLKIRIGLHSGPVVAGVVGLTMPRYCLFGDTVNTASRMESNSKPFKIHMSGSTQALLKKYPEYILEDRGPLEIKGKGTMNTYFLEKYDDGTGIEYPGMPKCEV
ncbi:atrial natriuretic peptide receptor 1-like [Mya arenaria]|uniref:atrial natriuretic peptide receptor 1-like n=1 Tax=Mya arenaria TaxID=6604 RepID=UPI0022E6B195|nr:atrial natriuretic peptide receptor 1-like [Mya arenaria]